MKLRNRSWSHPSQEMSFSLQVLMFRELFIVYQPTKRWYFDLLFCFKLIIRSIFSFQFKQLVYFKSKGINFETITIVGAIARISPRQVWLWNGTILNFEPSDRCQRVLPYKTIFSTWRWSHSSSMQSFSTKLSFGHVSICKRWIKSSYFINIYTLWRREEHEIVLRRAFCLHIRTWKNFK